jgi:hypothetical protein
MTNVKSYNNDFNYLQMNFTDFVGGIYNSASTHYANSIARLTVTSTSNTVLENFIVKDCMLFGGVITFNGNGSQLLNAKLLTSYFFETGPVLNGNVLLTIDGCTGYLFPTCTGGATYALSNTSEMIQGRYTPTNYVLASEPDNASTPSIHSHLIGIDNALSSAYGEMNFQNGFSQTPISAPGVAVKVAGVYVSGLLSGFSQASGTLTYTSSQTKVYKVIANVTCTYNANARDTSFYIAKNGVVLSKSKMQTFIGTTTPGNQTCVSSCLVSLATNDTIEVYVANENDTITPYVTTLNCMVF